MSERHLWETRAAVEKNQQRIVSVPAADLNSLLDSAETDFFERVNALIRFDRDLLRDAVLRNRSRDDQYQNQDDRDGNERKHKEPSSRRPERHGEYC